jgi:hypothetical protein
MFLRRRSSHAALFAGWQMPGFDVPLAADLINKAEAEGARQEARISGSRSRRRRIYCRDDLAPH